MADQKKNPKHNFNYEKPLSFRMPDDVHQIIEDYMIENRIFNKSKVHREIFSLGMEVFKKNIGK